MKRSVTYLWLMVICFTTNIYASSFYNPYNDFSVSPLESSIVGPDHTFTGFLKKLANGRTIHVFRLDPGESGNHVGYNGAIAKRFSDDDGKTWSIPEIIYKDSYDDRVGSGGVLDNGDIIVFFGRYQMTGVWSGYYVDIGYITSKDNGDTWSGMTFVENTGKSALFMDVFKIPGKSGYFCATYGSYYADLRYSPDGVKWDSVYTKLDYTGTREFAIVEPVFTPIGNGKIICIFRIDRIAVHQTVSADDGKTWSQPMPTTLANGAFCSYPFQTYDEKLNKLYTIVCDRQGADYDMLNFNSGAWIYCNDPDEIFNDPKSYGNCRFVPRGYPNILRQLGYPYATKTNDSTYLVIMTDAYKKMNSLEDAEIYQFYINISKDVYILKNTQTITFAENQEIPFDAVDNNVAYASSGLPVTYTSSDESILKIINGKIVPTGIGQCFITASQSGDNFYYKASSVTQKVNVVKADQYVSIEFDQNVQLGAPDIVVSYQAKTYLPITCVSSDTTVAMIEFGKIKIVGFGVCYITAKQEGNYFYNSFTSEPKLLSVIRKTQFIDFNVPPVVNISQKDLLLNANASSGLPIEYESSDNSIAYIIGNKLYILGTGVCIITAKQEGNNQYEPASSVSKSLKIEKSNQTISFALQPSIPADKKRINLDAHASSGLPVSYESSDNSVAYVYGDSLIIVSSGFCVITARQDGNDVYNSANPISKTLKIDKIVQNISFSLPPVVPVNTSNLKLNAQASSGLDVEYEVSDTKVAVIMNGDLDIVGEGFCVVTAKQIGNNIYNAVSISKTIKVEKLNQTVSFTMSPSVLANIGEININAQSTSGLQVEVVSSDNNVAYYYNNKLIIVAPGVCTITVKQEGNNVYNPAVSISKTLRVDKVNQTIDFTLPTLVMIDNGTIDLKAVSSSGLKVNFTSSDSKIAEVINGILYIKASGICMITAKQEGNVLYNPAVSISKSIRIEKYSQSLEIAASKTQMYVTDSDLIISTFASSGLPVSLSITDTNVLVNRNGKYIALQEGFSTIVASQMGNSIFNKAEQVFITIQVNKKPQLLTIELPSKLNYGDTVMLTSTASSGLELSYSIVDTTILSIKNNRLIAKYPGATDIVTKQDGNNEYLPAPGYTNHIRVYKANQSINDFEVPLQFVYLDSPFTISTTATSKLPIKISSSDSSVIKIINDSAYIIGTGKCQIIASQSGNDYYVKASSILKEIEVLKAKQSISFGKIDTLVYGDGSVVLFSESSSKLPVEYVSSDTTIAKISGNTLLINNAGIVTISAKQLGNNLYNSAIDVLQTVVIKKANQYITFEKLPSFEFKDTVLLADLWSSSGLQVELISSDTNIAKVSGSNIIIKSAGECIITALQKGNKNYNSAVAVTRGLNILKKTQQIEFELQSQAFISDSSIKLNATSNLELPISYKSSDESIAYIEGDVLKIVSVGSCVITAFQPGNENCKEAEPVSRLITIMPDTNKAEVVIIGYPNPAKEFLYLKNAENATVRIIDMKGKLVNVVQLGSDACLDITYLTSGVYYAHVISPSISKTILFEKQ